MAKNYDLFLERMKQKYNMPQTTYKPQTSLEQQNTLLNKQNQFYNPAQAEEQQQSDYDKLNLWDKIGSSYIQARTSFEKSFLDLGEGVIDSVLMGVGSIAELTGNEELENTMRDWTKAEWLSTLPEQDWFNNIVGFDFLWSDEAREVARQGEALPEIVDQVASGMGSAVGFGLLNMIPVAGTALSFMGSAGSAAEEALKEGAGTTEATLYGAATGAVEYLGERFLGEKVLTPLGIGLGKFAGFGKGTAKSIGKSAVSKIVSNVGRNFIEEGMEEVVSELADPLLKKLTYKQDENLKDLYEEQITPESLIETFLVGGLTGGIFEGATTIGGVASSGGLKSWNIRQEARELNRINSEMYDATIKGDEEKIQNLENEKSKKIEEVQQKFESFKEDVIENPKKWRKVVSLSQYETQRNISRTDIALEVARDVYNGKSKNKETPRINVEKSPIENGVQKESYYDPNTNTVYLNEQNLSNLQSALETITHEAGHAIHTTGLNTNFVNQMTENFTDYDSLIDKGYQGKVNNMQDLISYYEDVKGNGNKLEKSDILKKTMEEKKISKEQAYAELRDNYMLEEIANDIFSKKYFSNLLELKQVMMNSKPSIIKRIKEAYRKRFTNTEKPSNYKEVMQIFKDGIEQNYSNFVSDIEKEKAKRRTDIRYKTEEIATQNKNVIDENFDAKKNKKFTINDEEFNVKGISWYEKQLEKLDELNEKYDNEEISENSYYNSIDKINEKIENEINNIENMLYEFERYDLEDSETELPKKESVEQVLNYVYQVEDFINNFMSDYDIVEADFTEYFDEESAIMQVYKKITSKENSKVVKETKTTKEELTRQTKINYLLKDRKSVDGWLSSLWDSQVFEDLYEKYKNFDEFMKENSGNFALAEDYLEEFSDKELDDQYEWKKEAEEKVFENEKSTEQKLREALRPQREKPQIDESKKIVVSKLKSTPKNAYNSFDKLLEKFGDIYSVFDYYSGEYHLNDWELSFLNEALYQNGRYDEQSKQDIIKYLKMENLDPYLEYQRYLNEGVYPENETKTEPKEEKKQPEYTQYDLTKYNTEKSLSDLGADLIVKIAEIENNSKTNFFSKDTPHNLASKIQEAKSYEEAKSLLDEYETRVNFIKNYFSQLKNVFKKMKNENFKTIKIGKEVEKRIGAINKYSSVSNVQNYVVNFLTEEKATELTNYVESLKQQSEEQIERQVAERQKQIEKQREEQLLKEKEAIEKQKDTNASVVRKKFETEIDNILHNYPYQKELSKERISSINKKIKEINYTNYENSDVIEDVKNQIKNLKNKVEQDLKDAKDKVDNLQQFKDCQNSINEAYKLFDDLDLYNSNENISIDKKITKTDKTISQIDKILNDNEKGLPKLISLLENSVNSNEEIVQSIILEKVDNAKQTKSKLEEKLDKLGDEYEALKLEKQEIIEEENKKVKEAKEKEKQPKVVEKVEEIKQVEPEKPKPLEEVKVETTEQLESKANELLEKVQKLEKKVSKQEKIKSKIKIIKETRVKYTESAKSIKEKANATQLKEYTKTVCSNLFDVVKGMIELVSAEQKTEVRLWYEDKQGKQSAIDEVFEIFNTMGINNDTKEVVDKIKDVILSGVEVKFPEYEFKNGRLVSKGRDAYTKLNDRNLRDTVIGKKIVSEVSYYVQQTMDNKGSATILAENIINHSSKLLDTIKEQRKDIEMLLKEVENTKLNNENINKASTEAEFNNVYAQLNKSNKAIEKLSKKIDEVSMNKDKVKKDVTELKQKNATLKKELLKKGKSLESTTKKLISARSNLEGVYHFGTKESAMVKGILENLDIKKIEVDQDTYNKISANFIDGNVDGCVEEIMNYMEKQQVKREVEIEGEGTKVEYVDFKEAYSKEVVSQIKNQVKNTLLDRINSGKVDAKLPAAYAKIKELKSKMSINKKTNEALNSIRKSISAIHSLSTNKTKSITTNNIDKRFKAIDKKLGRFSKSAILKGDFRETLKDLKTFVTTEKIFENQTFSDLTGIEFPQDLIDKIEQLNNVKGEVTVEELQLYENVLKALKKYIESATGDRKLSQFLKEDGTEYTVKEFVQEALKEQQELLKKIPKEKWTVVFQGVDPRVVFNILSGYNENSAFNKLFRELQKGDTNAMYMEMQLKEKLENFYKENKKFKKSLGKETTIGDITTSKGNFISIYKLLQRQDSYEHFKTDGIDLDGKNIKFKSEDEIKKLKKDIETSLELNDKNSLNRKFLDLTVKFFEDAADAKEKIDVQLYGYSNVLRVDENGNKVEYFPIKISSLEFNRTLGEQKYISKMAASFNYSWLKSVTGSAGALKITNVQDVIDLHSRQVAQYYGYGIPLDLFNQIYSYKIYNKETNQLENLKRLTNERFGTNKKGQYMLEDYLKILFDDIRGVNTYNGEVDGFFKKMFATLRNRYSTYVLGANIKVAGVQLAAIPSTYKYVSLKNMVNAFKPIDWDKYKLPTLGEYRTYDKSILKSETLNDKVGKVADAFGKLMTKTDQYTIKYAWKAALYETNFDTKKATELFEKIVRETQPQYSAIERSALMRSKNDLVKLLTQFQSQSNKNFSTIMEVYYKAKYYKQLGKKLSAEDIKQFRKSLTSIAMQSATVVALTYLIKFIFNDLDDDEVSVLDVLESFFNDGLGMIPLMNNIKLDLEKEGKWGYIDFYEPNLGAINKLYDSLTDLGNFFGEDVTNHERIYNAFNTVGVFTGIPVSNLYKYSIGLLKHILPNYAFSFDAKIKGITFTNKTEINKALDNGKIEVARQYYETYTTNILSLDKNVTNTLFNLYKQGYKNAYIKQVPKTLTVDGEQVEVDREEFIKVYSKLTPQLQKLVSDPQFKRLSNEEKEKTISKLVNLYYSLAKKSVIGDKDYNNLETIVLYYKNFNAKNFAYLSYIDSIEAKEVNGKEIFSRKENVQRYINSLQIPAGEKYLLYYLSGYSLSEKNTKILKSFLSSRGVPNGQIKALLN